MSSMTADDWMELIEAEGPRLREMGWVIEGGRIRNREGQCPLCALCALHGAETYSLAWSFALKEAFPDCGDWDTAYPITLAADNLDVDDPAYYDRFRRYRTALLGILGLPFDGEAR